MRKHTTINELIDRARRRLRLSQSELARRASLSQPAISDIVNGKVKPRLETLRKLMPVLELSIADVFAE